MLSSCGESTVVRIWHGWTSPADADAYLQLLDTTIVPGITERSIPGHRSTEVLRRDSAEITEGDVEFITIMVFDDWNSVVEFAGGDGSASVVPESARKLLSHFDERSQHYETVASHPAR